MFAPPGTDSYLVPPGGGYFHQVTHGAWRIVDVYHSQPWIICGSDENYAVPVSFQENTGYDARDGSVRMQQGDTVVVKIQYLQCGKPKPLTMSEFTQEGGSQTIELPNGYQYRQYGSLECGDWPSWVKSVKIVQDNTNPPKATVTVNPSTESHKDKIFIEMGNTRDGAHTVAVIDISQAGTQKGSDSTKAEPEGISVSPQSSSIYIGSTDTITPTVKPATADQSVTWSSSNSSVATVSSTGVVKGVSPGTAVITAKTVNGLTATCDVRVKVLELEGKIELEKDAYPAGAIIKVKASDIPEEYVKSKAFSAIYRIGAAHHEYGDYEYVNAGESTFEIKAPNLNGKFEMRLYSSDRANASNASYVMSVPFTLSGATEINSSEWATEELYQAEMYGLFPDVLQEADLSRPITRLEFAAVSVKTYESISGTMAIPAVNNPFTDSADPEMLKAYNLGIAIGVSANKFDPNGILNREQAATMLTRVFKKVTLKGWSIENDDNFLLPYTKPAPFADDASISDWAKDSVYFMAANGIIKGVGNNMFAPRATTSTDQAMGYATATREQALIMAVRMVDYIRQKN